MAFNRGLRAECRPEARPIRRRLPLVLVDGAIASAGSYPTRVELAEWTGLALSTADQRPANHLVADAQTGGGGGSARSGCC